MAQMMVGLLSSIASQESSTLSYRIKSGKMSGALCGKAYNGRLFVYDKVNGEQIVNEDKAQIVRKMFDMILEGNGCRKIAQYLNENHGEYKNGNWNSATVHSLIVNPFFMGKRRFKDVVMEVEPIVSEEIFEQAQAFLKSRFRFVSDSKHVNPFASFINCKCGATFTQTIIGSMRTDLYKCSNSCGVKSINRPYLISEVKALLEENAKLTQDKDERLKYNARIKLNVSLINSNLKRMFTLEKMSEKNYDLFTSEKINEKKFDEALLRYEDELVKLKDDNGRMLETNKAIKISLKNDILYYSDNLEIFKRQLLPILESIVIDEKYCTINMKGFSMMYFYIHRGHELQSYRGYIKKNGTSKGFKYNLNRDDLEDNTKMMIDNHLVPHLS
jgi:phage protein U